MPWLEPCRGKDDQAGPTEGGGKEGAGEALTGALARLADNTPSLGR